MDENTKNIYLKYGIDPEQREKENLELIKNRQAEIDTFIKKNLSDDFEKGLNDNFERLKSHRYYPIFYCFKELESNIWEAVKCLMLNYYSASITLTNHILERTLKLALIENEVGALPNSIENWNEKYSKSHQNFSKLPLNKTIKECFAQNLITEEQLEELNKYRTRIRNGFSHYDTEEILKDSEDIVEAYIHGSKFIESKTIPLNLKQIPILQTKYVNKFAKENAEEYFDFVFGIIKHIQRQFMIRYYNENQEKTKK